MKVLIYEDLVSSRKIFEEDENVRILGVIEEENYEDIKKLLDKEIGTMAEKEDHWIHPWYQIRIKEIPSLRADGELKEKLNKLIGLDL